jgi:hypothetical protein
MCMSKWAQLEHPLTQVHMAELCTHPSATDRLEGIFGEHLRRFFCFACEHGWWESNGSAVGSTAALGLIARLAKSPRPRGWQSRETEWQKLADDGLVPTGARR